jgi:hypothetical protein
MTNFLLLLILLALLAGFGFLSPILWIVGAIVGVLIIVQIMRLIGKSLDVFLEPFGKSVRLFFLHNSVHWSLIGIISFISVFCYLKFKITDFLYALTIPAVFALFKTVSYLDTVSIRRKYARSETNEKHGNSGDITLN